MLVRRWLVVPTHEGIAVYCQRLAEQRLGLVVLALGQKLPREGVHGEACVLANRAFGLESCSQKLEAQLIAALFIALSALVAASSFEREAGRRCGGEDK